MKITRGQLFTHILCLIPFAFLSAGYFQDSLTANPIQALTLKSGRTSIFLLMLSLACRPLSNLFGLTSLIKIRKILGIYAFFYASFHFLVFSGLDFEFNLSWILAELKFKPFIQIGLAALILLIPLAITSVNSIRKRMGKNWQILHRLAYFIAFLAIVHFLMAVKGDIILPLIYGIGFLILMILRVPPLSRISLSAKPKWLNAINRFLLKS